MQFTESVRSFQVPETPGTSAWPPRMPSVPTSRATRVTSSANVCSVAVIEFRVCASSATSPRAVTVICWLRSPRATACATDEMPRTWLVRLDAITFTESVRSFQVPETPRTSAWPPSRPSVPTSRATRVTSEAKDDSWSTIRSTVYLQLRHLAGHLDGDGLGEVAVRHGRRHQGDVAHLRGQPRRHRVDRVDQVAPGAVRVAYPCLAAELALGADLAGDPGDLVGDAGELVDQPVHALGQLERLAAQRLAVQVEVHALGQVALGDGGDDAGQLARRADQVGDQVVRGLDRLGPAALADAGLEALGVPALAAGDTLDAGQLAGEVLLPLGDLVVGQGQVDREAGARDRKALAEVAVAHGVERVEEASQLGRVRAWSSVRCGAAGRCRDGATLRLGGAGHAVSLALGRAPSRASLSP